MISSGRGRDFILPLINYLDCYRFENGSADPDPDPNDDADDLLSLDKLNLEKSVSGEGADLEDYLNNPDVNIICGDGLPVSQDFFEFKN